MMLMNYAKLHWILLNCYKIIEYDFYAYLNFGIVQNAAIMLSDFRRIKKK